MVLKEALVEVENYYDFPAAQGHEDVVGCGFCRGDVLQVVVDRAEVDNKSDVILGNKVILLFLWLWVCGEESLDTRIGR